MRRLFVKWLTWNSFLMVGKLPLLQFLNVKRLSAFCGQFVHFAIGSPVLPQLGGGKRMRPSPLLSESRAYAVDRFFSRRKVVKHGRLDLHTAELACIAKSV